MPHTAYLSLGSNLGDRRGNLESALHRLPALGTVSAVSSIYETAPVEYVEQPWFLNCAVQLETELSPVALLHGILQIEQDMGRKRAQPKGPRQIDIDILLFDAERVSSPELTIPHPALPDRRFVLEPLVEIAPRMRHPQSGKTVLELRDQLPSGQAVKRLKAR